MQVIPVEAYGFGPTFSSIEASVRHALKYAPLARAKADAALFRDSEIIDGFWTDTEWVLRFSNGRFLHVAVEAGRSSGAVTWRVLEREPVVHASDVQRVGSEPVILDFARVGAHERGLPYVMDRSKMMAARRGRPFKAFFVNELAFYVYTPRQRILCFGCVRRRDTNTGLLYVYEDD